MTALKIHCLLRQFFKYNFKSSNFAATLVLAGNHEFYNEGYECETTMEDAYKSMVSIINEFENVYFLEKTTVIIGKRALDSTHKFGARNDFFLRVKNPV